MHCILCKSGGSIQVVGPFSDEDQVNEWLSRAATVLNNIPISYEVRECLEPFAYSKEEGVQVHAPEKVIPYVMRSNLQTILRFSLNSSMNLDKLNKLRGHSIATQIIIDLLSKVEDELVDSIEVRD